MPSTTRPRDIHPSEPNYIWLEAGDNLGITDDDDPLLNHRTTQEPPVRAAGRRAGVSWKSYQEDIPARHLPARSRPASTAPKHNPIVFFDDVTERSRPASRRTASRTCGRTGSSGATLAGATVARVQLHHAEPVQRHARHQGCASTDAVANGDAWLRARCPKILASKAYQNGGALFITWDESEDGNEPIGLIALSPFAKPGYAGDVRVHAQLAAADDPGRLGLRPFIRAAANATPLDDLFVSYP